MTLSTTLKKARRKLAETFAGLHEEIAELRRQIATTRQELRRAESAPIPIEEIHDRIEVHVRDTGERWLRDRGAALLRGDHALGAPGLRGGARLPWLPTEAPPWGAVCAGDPASATAILRGLTDRLDYEPGPASTERAAVVARLEGELRELEEMEESLIDEAAAAGVVVEHRDEVRQRRERERRAHELEDQRVRDRAERQRALDEAHASRSRGSRFVAPRGPLASLTDPT